MAWGGSGLSWAKQDWEETMLKSHIMIAFGLLLMLIYGLRLLTGFSLSDGFGLGDAYLLGGLGLAGALMWSGWRERRYARSIQQQES